MSYAAARVRTDEGSVPVGAENCLQYIGGDFFFLDGDRRRFPHHPSAMRSPELRAEIARGKRPVAVDPNERAYDALEAAFHAHQGPFRVPRFRPPPATGGTRADFAVRLATLKRSIANGNAYLRRLLEEIGHAPGDLDRAITHSSAVFLERARGNAIKLCR